MTRRQGSECAAALPREPRLTPRRCVHHQAQGFRDRAGESNASCAAAVIAPRVTARTMLSLPSAAFAGPAHLLQAHGGVSFDRATRGAFGARPGDLSPRAPWHCKLASLLAWRPHAVAAGSRLGHNRPWPTLCPLPLTLHPYISTEVVCVLALLVPAADLRSRQGHLCLPTPVKVRQGQCLSGACLAQGRRPCRVCRVCHAPSANARSLRPPKQRTVRMASYAVLACSCSYANTIQPHLQ